VSEPNLRLILVAVMVMSLFLPADPEAGPNWFFSYWYSMESLIGISEVGFGSFVVVLGTLLYLWAIPILILMNVCLSVLPTKGLKTFYRIVLLILFPLTWCATLIMGFRGIGFWANPVLVSAVGLLEVFVAKGQLEKSRNADQK
jgi:hypothetical protein